MEAMTTFFSEYTQITYPAGHVVVAAFSVPPGVYMVKSGLVKQYTLTPTGHELIVNIYKPGSFFPMMWAVTQLPNNYFFETMEKSVLYRAPMADTVTFLQSQPAVMYDLLRRLYTGMDGLLQQLTYAAVGDTHKKVVASLLMLAKRFGEWHGSQVVISKHFSHKEIGLLTGTSRESVTRILQVLKSEGLMAVDQKVMTIPDVKQLEIYLLSSPTAPV